MLVSEVSSLEEWKERQIKSGRWQSMTPEQQSSSIRHQKEEHITPEEIGKMATNRQRQNRGANPFAGHRRSKR